jgi:hypothetical protein
MHSLHDVSKTLCSYEFNNIMVSDFYIKNLLKRYIDDRFLNFQENEIITNFIELEEQPIFGPQLSSDYKELSKHNSTSIKELRGVLASKFAGFKSLSKGGVDGLAQKMKAARLHMLVNPEERDTIQIDLKNVVQKFFEREPEAEGRKDLVPFVSGQKSFLMTQLSPMIESLVHRPGYTRVKVAPKKMFGSFAADRVQGRSVEQIGQLYDQMVEKNKVEIQRRVEMSNYGSTIKRKVVEEDPFTAIERANAVDSKKTDRLIDQFEAKQKVIKEVGRFVNNHAQKQLPDYKRMINMLSLLGPVDARTEEASKDEPMEEPGVGEPGEQPRLAETPELPRLGETISMKGHSGSRLSTGRSREGHRREGSGVRESRGGSRGESRGGSVGRSTLGRGEGRGQRSRSALGSEVEVSRRYIEGREQSGRGSTRRVLVGREGSKLGSQQSITLGKLEFEKTESISVRGESPKASTGQTSPVRLGDKTKLGFSLALKREIQPIPESQEPINETSLAALPRLFFKKSRLGLNT